MDIIASRAWWTASHCGSWFVNHGARCDCDGWIPGTVQGTSAAVSVFYRVLEHESLVLVGPRSVCGIVYTHHLWRRDHPHALRQPSRTRTRYFHTSTVRKTWVVTVARPDNINNNAGSVTGRWTSISKFG